MTAQGISLTIGASVAMVHRHLHAPMHEASNAEEGSEASAKGQQHFAFPAAHGLGGRHRR
jgi:hypothetical protein